MRFFRFIELESILTILFLLFVLFQDMTLEVVACYLRGGRLAETFLDEPSAFDVPEVIIRFIVCRESPFF